jgi:mRNA interferase RelE/StbE
VTYDVRLAKDASAYLQRLDRPTRNRILDRLDQLAEDPFHPTYTKPLTDPHGRRSARVGSYRIVFLVDAAANTVNVSVIASRGQVYRDL